jgi:hypothetical protein
MSQWYLQELDILNTKTKKIRKSSYKLVYVRNILKCLLTFITFTRLTITQTISIKKNGFF